MDWTVSRRRQVEEYVNEYLTTRSRLKTGGSKRDFRLWYESLVGGTLLGQGQGRKVN